MRRVALLSALSVAAVFCQIPQPGPIGAAPSSGTLIASGSTAMGTAAISSGACAPAVTVPAPGVLTSDVIEASFNSDPTTIVGYQPSTAGTLTIIKYVTAGNVNFEVCNNTQTNPVTPGAVTLNWSVRR